ncbi:MULTISPECIES: ABC transporter permease [Micromonospora]|uniref:Quaternary ammonium transporter n=2 Tax=Micromonospora TaxID=1873 RepID=A0A9X0LE31_9ACTN|nr:MULTISPECIES: ABC transporter permease [Micromonospora]AEB47636.1 binding-protein-dependent transport systems inner membrane component [Micromonospora maris AB-18-032]KUJ46676.1 quaternary ammonium transporter [Micromonospora maris]MBL6278676.1 ABC transporter permease [Micromonospora fiedleri]RUL93948.1 ABC transporter permease [Verrucosispora sp. FIM060022]WSK42907.1 ABC transporter permease [Micromonospora maris]
MSFRLSYRADPGNPWFSWQYVRDNSDTVLAALRDHTTLTLRAVLIATLIAVPLAVVAYWFRPLTGPIVALTGVLYTVPSLALFAFVAPYLGIGVATVLSVVVLYALLVIVRNTVAGLNQVPAEVREAAEGMGYGRWGRLLRVELPLALPGILTGLRLATVSTVALITVGVVIGRGGLGQIIFAGFNNNFYKAQIMTGTLLCVLLALVLDLLLVGVGRLLTPWLRGRVG